jgi:hypothetical protein
MACCVAAERILTERPILASVNSKLLEKVGTYLSPVRDTQGHERSWGVSPMRQHCPSTTLSTIGARRSSIRLRTPPPGIRGDEAVAPLWLAINRPAKRNSRIIPTRAYGARASIRHRTLAKSPSREWPERVYAWVEAVGTGRLPHHPATRALRHDDHGRGSVRKEWGGSPGSRTCRSPACPGSPRPSSQSSKWMATATGREPPAEGPLAANSRGEHLRVASAAGWRGISPIGFPSEREPWQKAPDVCAHFGKRLPIRG